jgi:hypothetical protein
MVAVERTAAVVVGLAPRGPMRHKFCVRTTKHPKAKSKKTVVQRERERIMGHVSQQRWGMGCHQIENHHNFSVIVVVVVIVLVVRLCCSSEGVLPFKSQGRSS